MVAPLQFAHTPPSAPHALLAVPSRQLPFEEQQPAQVVSSQTQVPRSHRVPAAQVLFGPQPQLPLERQVSALTGSQGAQLPPGSPQFSVDRVSHTPRLQQPSGQVLTEHGAGPQVPASQLPPPHETHVPPPAPQLLESVPGWQMPLAQQPPGQVVASQVVSAQPPSWQLSDGQAAQLAPPPPQLLGEVPGWHAPVESQQPLGQLVALHWLVVQARCRQAPAPQLSHSAPP
jgi:hypothetical protein